MQGGHRSGVTADDRAASPGWTHRCAARRVHGGRSELRESPVGTPAREGPGRPRRRPNSTVMENADVGRVTEPGCPVKCEFCFVFFKNIYLSINLFNFIFGEATLS